MADNFDEENEAHITVSFTLARGPISPKEMAEFIQDLAEIASALRKELIFPGQNEAPRDNCENDPANDSGSPGRPQI